MNKGKRKAGPSGSVRIIGGKWRSRRIQAPLGDDLRPTPDRVRETLFNWLAPVLPGAACLDLFAGTGALGFEALSRGAASCVMVDRNAEAVAAIEAFAGSVGAAAEILQAESALYLGKAQLNSFDIVFVDPPYRHEVSTVLTTLLPLLKPGSQVYLERDQRDAWPEHDAYRWHKRGSAGQVEFGLATLRSH